VFKYVYMCLRQFLDFISAYVHIDSSYILDGITRGKVRNLLHCCVKQWVDVDLTSSVLKCLSESAWLS